MTIKYPFTKDGIKWFEDDTLADIMNHLDNDNPNDRHESENDFNIFITIGNREIKVPMIPESFESITDFLKTTLEVFEDVENEQ
jgi:hypothetical protein